MLNRRNWSFWAKAKTIFDEKSLSYFSGKIAIKKEKRRECFVNNVVVKDSNWFRSEFLFEGKGNDAPRWHCPKAFVCLRKSNRITVSSLSIGPRQMRHFCLNPKQLLFCVSFNSIPSGRFEKSAISLVMLSKRWISDVCGRVCACHSAHCLLLLLLLCRAL